MARVIRFPLQMKDGAAVRTLEELREHFDLESVLGYFADGKLQTWLANRYYDELAQKVGAMSSDMPDLSERLCEILGVEYVAQQDQTDFDVIQRRREKLQILAQYTDDKAILDNVDAVAFDQDELFDILDEAPSVIYLYGEKFSVPYSKGNITYIGINNPLVILDNDRFLSEYKNNDVVFNNIRFENGINLYAIKGESDFLAGDLQTAFELVKKSALNGNPRAMYIMACFYDQGYGVIEPNAYERNEWCKKAFNHHEPLSTYGYIKWCIPKGVDKTSHYQEIVDDIKSMAETDDTLAQGILAEMLRNGLGIARDYEQSVSLFTKAAEKGDARSQYSLGLMYKMGIGVERDLESATTWLEVAADRNYRSALRELIRIERPLYDIKEDNDDTDMPIGEKLYISGEYDKAFPIIEHAAQNGNPRAMYIIAMCYKDGSGTVCDLNKCQEWLKRAYGKNEPLSTLNYAFWCCKDNPEKKNKIILEVYPLLKTMSDKGDILAQFEFGDLLWKRDGTYFDGKKLIEKAAKAGFAPAQNALGYHEASHIGGDGQNGFKMLTKSAEQGYAPAQSNLGFCYRKGWGVSQNFDLALLWYRKSVQQGYAEAQNRLGAMYFNGLGVNTDKEKAIELWRKAAKQGNWKAIENLASEGIHI